MNRSFGIYLDHIVSMSPEQGKRVIASLRGRLGCAPWPRKSHFSPLLLPRGGSSRSPAGTSCTKVPSWQPRCCEERPGVTATAASYSCLLQPSSSRLGKTVPERWLLLLSRGTSSLTWCPTSSKALKQKNLSPWHRVFACLRRMGIFPCN